MSEQLSIQELVRFVERLGPELGWSSKYIDLVATTAGAVFRGLGLDESRDVIFIGPSVLPMQQEQLRDDLRRRGLSERTVSTYVGTWKRVSEIAGEWIPVRGTPKEDYFWENVHNYRDSRPRRRTTRTSATSVPDSGIQEGYSSLDPMDDLRASNEVIEVPLDDGVALIVLPQKISQAEATRVIGALLNEGVHKQG